MPKKRTSAQLERDIADVLGARGQAHRDRHWYFAELNEVGGIRERFGPFASKQAAARAQQRATILSPEKHWDRVHSSIERYPSNVPNWMRNG